KVEPVPIFALLAALVLEPPELPEPPVLPVLPEPPEPPEPPVESPKPSAEPEVIGWSAPAGCPSGEELRRGMERRLGRTLAAGEAQAEGRVELREAGGYRLTLRTTVEGVTEERALEADDCRALADATALIVALAIDPVAVAEVIEPWGGDPLEPPPAPVGVESGPLVPAPAEGPAEPEPEPAETPPEAIEPASRSRPGGLFRVGGGVGLGAIPGVTGALALAGGLRWRRARLELEGSYW